MIRLEFENAKKLYVSIKCVYRVIKKKGNPIFDYLSARENTSYHNSNIVKSHLDVLQWSVQNMEN